MVMSQQCENKFNNMNKRNKRLSFEKTLQVVKEMELVIVEPLQKEQNEELVLDETIESIEFTNGNPNDDYEDKCNRVIPQN